MAIRTKLSNEDRDELTKDVNDLDKVYLEKMKEEDTGIQTVVNLFTNKLNDISKTKLGKDRNPNLVEMDKEKK